MLWLLLSMSFAQASGSAPQTLVTRFYTVYIKEHSSGLFLQGNARRALLPSLSKRLRQRLEDAVACQADWVRQQPKGSTDKPPFVDCCLFSGTADGMPTSFALGPTEVLPDGRHQIIVDFVRKETAGVIKWRDAAIVMQEGDRFAIDDVVYDVDPASRDRVRLSEMFQGCRGRRWIGGRWRAGHGVIVNTGLFTALEGLTVTSFVYSIETLGCVHNSSSRRTSEFSASINFVVTRIRLTKKLAAVLNGIDVSSLKVGDIIELPDSAARIMVAEGWAEHVTNPIAAHASRT
jgi:hypothetical protein